MTQTKNKIKNAVILIIVRMYLIKLSEHCVVGLKLKMHLLQRQMIFTFLRFLIIKRGTPICQRPMNLRHTVATLVDTLLKTSIVLEWLFIETRFHETIVAILHMLTDNPPHRSFFKMLPIFMQSDERTNGNKHQFKVREMFFNSNKRSNNSLYLTGIGIH